MRVELVFNSSHSCIDIFYILIIVSIDEVYTLLDPLFVLRCMLVTCGFANGNRTNLERRMNEGVTKN